MIEGLWSVEFASNVGIPGAGVVVFETERVFGGDAQYTYLGSYVLRNGCIKGAIKVKSFTKEPYSVFGDADDFDLCIEGQLSEPTFLAKGRRLDNPNHTIDIRFTKRAELP